MAISQYFSRSDPRIQASLAQVEMGLCSDVPTLIGSEAMSAMGRQRPLASLSAQRPLPLVKRTSKSLVIQNSDFRFRPQAVGQLPRYVLLSQAEWLARVSWTSGVTRNGDICASYSLSSTRINSPQSRRSGPAAQRPGIGKTECRRTLLQPWVVRDDLVAGEPSQHRRIPRHPRRF